MTYLRMKFEEVIHSQYDVLPVWWWIRPTRERCFREWRSAFLNGRTEIQAEADCRRAELEAWRESLIDAKAELENAVGDDARRQWEYEVAFCQRFFDTHRRLLDRVLYRQATGKPAA